MPQIIDSVLANPSAIASLVAALVGASVALVVMAITQFLNFRKERTQFLTPKLEELYLLLNDLSEHNATTFKILYLAHEGDEESRKSLAMMDDLDLYGHRRAKKIVMIVRLYFPHLASIHQQLFAAERELNQIKYALHSDALPDIQDLVSSSGRVGHFLRLMEQEIIRNRDRLLSSNIFPKRYRRTSAAEIKDEIPPPTGLPMEGTKRSSSSSDLSS